MDWKSSQTYQNLKEAFAAEAMASMRYHYYATTARREKMVHICELFDACEKYELEHAKMWYKRFYEGDGTTASNLGDVVEFETAEQQRYAEFALQARQEGYEEIAEKFEEVARIAAENCARFSKWRTAVEAGTVFTSSEPQHWQCSTCGNVMVTREAPEVCPVCDHGKAYYRVIYE